MLIKGYRHKRVARANGARGGVEREIGVLKEGGIEREAWQNIKLNKRDKEKLREYMLHSLTLL